MENKPISVVRKELVETLANTINSFNLPAFIIEPVLKDLYMEAQQMVEIEYKRDLEQYEQSKQIET